MSTVMNNLRNKLSGIALAAMALLLMVVFPSCNKSDSKYFGVSQKLTEYGVVKDSSWYKFRDSLGTAIDSFKVIKVTNTFAPIANEPEDNLYQTITVNFKHFPSLKSSKIVMVREKEKSTLTYTDTLNQKTIILTDPMEAGATIATVDAIQSGKYWYTDIMVVSETNNPNSKIYIAKGKWIVKKMYSYTPAQNWILDNSSIQ